MNKIMAFNLLIVAMLGGAWFVRPAGAAAQAPVVRRSIDVNSLSPELTIPVDLPASLDDPILMEAWIRLYSRQAPIRLWDGRILTGRDLAQFLLEQDIPVVWDTGGVCGQGSCSVKSCVGDMCTFDDGKPGTDPIYLLPLSQPLDNGMEGLVSTLAHEIFHRTEPFGPVADTRFEEYWAFFVSAQISPSAGLKFGAYNSLDPNHLSLWIRANRVDAYFQLPAYPPSIEPCSSSVAVSGIPNPALDRQANP